MLDLAPFIAFASRLADDADAMLRAATADQLSVDVKPDKTFVTSLDLEIEMRMRERLFDAFPSHGIWGEEFTAVATDAEFVWTLDPIDGTMAFIAGIPVYSTLISLCHEGIPVVGIMHFPATGERWIGAKGAPTTHNTRACTTRATASLETAIMTASNPDFFSSAIEKSALAMLTAHTAWRVYGTAAMAYGRLATGRTQVALDAGLKIYDYAPFVPIIEGAGGTITDWDGRGLRLGSGSCVLAAADASLHEHALHTIASSAPKVQK